MNKLATVWITMIMLLTTFVIAAEFAEANRQELCIIEFTDEVSERTVMRYRGDIVGVHDTLKIITARLTPRAQYYLARNKGIEYVEKDFPVESLAQTLPWGVDTVEADLVHGEYTGAGVKIAVLDTGIDHEHPDLEYNYAGGYDYVNSDTDPMDDNGHGTHVAGTIAAVDNDFGVIGVAPGASLYGVKVLGSDGKGSGSNIIAGINWAIDNEMDIISMSLGSSTGSSSLLNACNAAVNAGIVLVAAAGNSGTISGTGDTVEYPARYSSVIAVSSIDSSLKRQTRASSGPTVELCAPGVSVYSTRVNDQYGYMSGSSMAAPHVSGVIALLLESNSGLTVTQIREILAETAYDLGDEGRDNLYGYGLVKADEAIAYEIAIPTAHVASIDMSFTTSDRQYTINTEILVRDENGDVLPGATVTMVLSYSGNSETTYTGDTDSNGIVTFVRGPTRRRSTYTATATDIVKTDHSYDPDANVVTYDSINVS